MLGWGRSSCRPTISRTWWTGSARSIKPPRSRWGEQRRPRDARFLSFDFGWTALLYCRVTWRRKCPLFLEGTEMIKVNVSERDLTGCCLVVNWRPGIKGCLASSHNHNKVLRESLCADVGLHNLFELWILHARQRVFSHHSACVCVFLRFQKPPIVSRIPRTTSPCWMP